MEYTKVELYVGTGFAGANHIDIVEIEKDLWESMTEDEQGDYLDNLATEFRNEKCECSARVIE